jgi:hypothetical protein
MKNALVVAILVMSVLSGYFIESIAERTEDLRPKLTQN